AYRLILTAPGLTDAQRADCALILANASGPDGMVAGQVLDTLHHPSAQDELTEVHHLKTGAMIAGACMLGVGAAGGSEAARKAAETYGYQLGLAFQIRDDMLDVIGNADEFGKPIGSDKDEGKVTYVDRLGLDDCGKLVHELTERAVSAVSDLDRDGFLTALAESLTERTK
ncbi:polyprenyl synthetase family protein, partial [Dysosmobacter sp.]